MTTATATAAGGACSGCEHDGACSRDGCADHFRQLRVALANAPAPTVIPRGLSIGALWRAVQDNPGLVDLLMSLYERWQDEKEYEPYSDYVAAVREYVPDTVGGDPRPFGVTVACSDGLLRLAVRRHGRSSLEVVPMVMTRFPRVMLDNLVNGTL